MSYYDIDAILTDAEKIPCTFEIDVPGLGYLDNNPSGTLKAGTQVNLPLWLAEMLALPNGADSRPFATLNLPPALSNDVAQALKADPRAVPLRDQSPHFYALAARMLDLFDEPELAAVLRRTFAVRAAEIALHARKAGAGAPPAPGSSAAGGRGAGGGSGGGEAGKAGGGGGGGGGGGAAAAMGKAVADDGGSVGIGGTGGEFLRGLDEWERKLFRQAHDGTKARKEWMDGVKRH